MLSRKVGLTCKCSRYQAEERECLVTLAHWNAGHVLVITQTSGNAPGWTINHLHLSISSHYCNVIGAASIGAGDGYQDIPSLLLPFKLGLWNVVRNIALQLRYYGPCPVGVILAINVTGVCVYIIYRYIISHSFNFCG